MMYSFEIKVLIYTEFILNEMVNNYTRWCNINLGVYLKSEYKFDLSHSQNVIVVPWSLHSSPTFSIQSYVLR